MLKDQKNKKKKKPFCRFLSSKATINMAVTAIKEAKVAAYVPRETTHSD